MNLPIKKIQVMINLPGTDIVFLTPDTESPYPHMNYPALAKLEAASGYGVEWVRKVFNREPDEILDMKGKT